MRVLEKYNIEPLRMLWMIVAGVVSAFGITCFLSPMHLYDSGIAGTSLLLSQLTPSWCNLSLFLVILNVPLMLYGLKKQGVAFTVYSVFAVVVYSVTALIIEYETNLETGSPIAGSDILLCAVFGGLICGAGSGIAVRHGGAIDGVEVMAVIFAKSLNLTVGTFMMIYNICLYIIYSTLNPSESTFDTLEPFLNLIHNPVIQRISNCFQQLRPRVNLYRGNLHYR